MIVRLGVRGGGRLLLIIIRCKKVSRHQLCRPIFPEPAHPPCEPARGSASQTEDRRDGGHEDGAQTVAAALDQRRDAVHALAAERVGRNDRLPGRPSILTEGGLATLTKPWDSILHSPE